jgi:hAT family C-terminal dimerisation region
LKDFLSGKRTTEITKSELDQYLDDPLDETSLDDDFDILTWWKLKSQTYPVMAKLTRDILAVPISTMASESTFSTSGRILSPV